MARKKMQEVLTFEGIDDGMEDCGCAFADAADLSFDAVPRVRKGGRRMAVRKLKKRSFLGLDLDAVPGVGGIDMDRVKSGAIIGGAAAASTLAIGAVLDRVAPKLDPMLRGAIGIAIGVIGGGLVYQGTKRSELATAVMVGPFFSMAQTLIAKVGIAEKGLAAKGYDAYDIVAVEPSRRLAGFGRTSVDYGLIAPEPVTRFSGGGSNGMGLISTEAQNELPFVAAY